MKIRKSQNSACTIASYTFMYQKGGKMSHVTNHSRYTTHTRSLGWALPSVGEGVGPPHPLEVWGAHVGIFVFHSSSLPLDTRGGVRSPTLLGVGSPFEGIITCHPPPKRGMTKAWWLMILVLGLWPLFCRFLFSFFRFRRRPFPWMWSGRLAVVWDWWSRAGRGGVVRAALCWRWLWPPFLAPPWPGVP